MSTQVRDPFLEVKIDTDGSTHYRVAHENIASVPYTRLPEPLEDGQYAVSYNLPNVPSTYTVSVQNKNSLHESAVISESVILLSDIVSTVSAKRNLLRIAQAFGPNVTPTTMCNEIKCYHGFVTLYNNSASPIDLSTVKIWTRYQNATSVPIVVNEITTGYTTNPDSPVSLTVWKSVTLTGTIEAGKYFLILGPEVASGNIQADGKSAEIVQFTTGVEGLTDFHVDLDLSASSDFYISSKLVQIVLTDSSVTSLPESIYADGALCTGFIDLYGCTANKSLVAAENFEIPQCMLTYFNDNSKQQLKTIINPVIEASSNLTDYTSTSIKTATVNTIRTNPLIRPRNSNFTGEYV